MDKRLRVAAALSVLLTITMVPGCGQPSSPSGGTVPPSSSGPVTGPSGSPSASAEATIRGRVEEGVEAGCIVLRGDDGVTYLLLGGDRALLVAGSRLEVVGQLEPDLVTTCQQGTPFTMVRARRI
jgi:hypothetical protein